MRNVVGYVISLVAIIIMLVITPNFYIGVTQWSRAQSEVLTYTRNLVDEVIDTRELRKDTLDDYFILIASTTELYDATITRKIKCVMPDPVNIGKTYTTYMTVDDVSSFNQGDIIVVKVEPIAPGVFQSLASSLLGMPSLVDGFTLSGRVR